MKIIDMHAHISDQRLFSPYFLEGVKNELLKSLDGVMDASKSSSLIDRLMKKKMNDIDCKELMNQMDDAGIEKTILLIADFGYGTDEEKLSINLLYDSYYAVLRKNPEKFVVFGGADPRRGKQGIDLFEKGIQKYGFKGLKLYPPCGYELNDTGLYPYYELCKQYDIPVLTHTGPSLKSMTIDKLYEVAVNQIASDFKEVNFVLGHAAFQQFDLNQELAFKYNNIFLESSGFQKLMGTPDKIKSMFLKLINSIPEKIVFGTDWPMFNTMNSQKSWVDFFKNIEGFSKEKQKLFFRDNALEILKS